MLWLTASQVVGKPSTHSAPEVKTEQPSQSAASTSDAAGTVVKQDTSGTDAEPATSAAETVTGVKDETEEKAVASEDSGSEKMDSENNDQVKATEAKEEVSYTL